MMENGLDISINYTTTMDYHRMSYEDFLSDMEAYGVKDKFPELKLIDIIGF